MSALERHLPDDVREESGIPLYFNCIDAIRVLAALAVVIFHYHHFYLADYLDRASIPAKSSFPYAELLEPLFAHGDKAVELFWVISGFVFTHVYLRAPTSLKRFAMARFARLYPLHSFTLLGVAVLQWLSLMQAGHWQIYGNNTAWYFLFQLFMASHWTNLSQGLSFNGPIWSVSLEIGAYFVFFYALTTLRRFGIWAALVLMALSWGFSGGFGLRLPLVQTGVFFCAGYFFCGVALYFLFLQLARKTIYLSGAVLLFGAAGMVAAPLGFKAWTDVAYFCALILLAGLADRHFGARAARLRSIGNISYGLYLVHVPLQMGVLLFADIVFDGTRTFADHPATLPAYLAGSILCAIWAFRYLERPAGQYLRRAGGRRSEGLF